MPMKEELTDAQWQIADAIARELVLSGTDVNELRKAIAYLRAVIHQEDASEKFFIYLKTLVRQGKQVSHSRRTQEYYQSIDKVCDQFLKGRISESEKLLVILGWAARLTIYYTSSDLSKKDIEQTIAKSRLQESERQHEIKKAVMDKSVAIGQVVEATITAIKGNQVTYEILGSIKLTQKEHKIVQKLQVNQLVRVEINQLRSDGVPKRIKFLE